MSPHDALRERAIGAMLGLAIGDAIAPPADVHRVVGERWSRPALWRGTAALDAQRVARPLLPFATTLEGIADLSPTDDAEVAVVAATVVMDAGAEQVRRAGVDAMFPGWLRFMAGDDVWGSVSTRSAVVNAAAGLRPPHTGSDNPAHYDDTAVAAAVAIGILCHENPALAAQVAGDYATITNAQDGVWAARLMAVAIAELVSGSPLPVALDAGEREVPPATWLGDRLELARSIVATDDPPFAVLPRLIAELSPRNYSHGGLAPSTVPLAFALLRLAGTEMSTVMPLALTFARTLDSLPAFVGALAGASAGSATIPATWLPWLSSTRGVTIPATAGVRLDDLVDRMLAAPGWQ